MLADRLSGGADEASQRCFSGLRAREGGAMGVGGLGKQTPDRGLRPSYTQARRLAFGRHSTARRIVEPDLRRLPLVRDCDHHRSCDAVGEGSLPNLDFYTAVTSLLMGIPRELYTSVFVCSRITGWCAHVIDQQDHNRLIRPRALYTGPTTRGYVSLNRRR